MNSEESQSIYDINKWMYFLVLCIFTFLLLFMKKSFIENETVAFQILDQRGQMGVIQLISGLQYLSIPLIYLFKLTIIAFVIWVGSFMFGYKITYGQTWHVALVGETIFLVAEFMKILYLLFFATDPTIFEIRAFYPLSAINLVDIYETSQRYFYPLKALNLFEVIYWFILVYGIHSMAKKKLKYAYAIVFSSYVFMFFLWLGFYTLIYK